MCIPRHLTGVETSVGGLKHKFFCSHPQRELPANCQCQINPVLLINTFFSYWFHHNQVYTGELKYCEHLLVCYVSASSLKEINSTNMTPPEMAAD